MFGIVSRGGIIIKIRTQWCILCSTMMMERHTAHCSVHWRGWFICDSPDLEIMSRALKSCIGSVSLFSLLAALGGAIFWMLALGLSFWPRLVVYSGGGRNLQSGEKTWPHVGMQCHLPLKELFLPGEKMCKSAPFPCSFPPPSQYW